MTTAAALSTLSVRCGESSVLAELYDPEREAIQREPPPAPDPSPAQLAQLSLAQRLEPGGLLDLSDFVQRGRAAAGLRPLWRPFGWDEPASDPRPEGALPWKIASSVSPASPLEGHPGVGQAPGTRHDIAPRATAVAWRPRAGTDRPWVNGRRQTWTLKLGLRQLQKARQVACRCRRIGESVGILAYPEGRLAVAGVETCGSIWACPVCSAKIRAQRAADVASVVEQGGAGCKMVSLTVSHRLGHSLRKVRAGVARAWRRFLSGAPWQRFRNLVGCLGQVRGLEVTHGEHGWHPHLHVLVVGTPGWPSLELDGMSVVRWLALRWIRCVAAEIGLWHIPSIERGCVVSDPHAGKYLVKLGLELVIDWHAKARGENRTPWQIAADYCRWHGSRDARLWRLYCAHMRGARQLTWSQDLRRNFALGAEKTDEELAVEQDAARCIGRIDADTWNEARTALTERGESVVVRALEIGERQGFEQLRWYLEREAARLRTARIAREERRRREQERPALERRAHDERARLEAGGWLFEGGCEHSRAEARSLTAGFVLAGTLVQHRRPAAR